MPHSHLGLDHQCVECVLMEDERKQSSECSLPAMMHLLFIYNLVCPRLYHPCHYCIKTKCLQQCCSFSCRHTIHAEIFHFCAINLAASQEHITITNTCMATKITHSLSISNYTFDKNVRYQARPKSSEYEVDILHTTWYCIAGYFQKVRFSKTSQ